MNSEKSDVKKSGTIVQLKKGFYMSGEVVGWSISYRFLISLHMADELTVSQYIDQFFPQFEPLTERKADR